MNPDSPYSILFEPVQIGPVRAKNRFYQVPHCNGMGRLYPSEMAAMRGNKAEGGWAVICTEQCDIHPTTDTRREIRLWDDRDIPYLARMVGEVHAHDALAGIELVHMGHHGQNLYSREPLMSPSGGAPESVFPGTARAMNKQDIRDVRRWHRNAALRAKRAGYDIVVVYAGHSISMAMHFLSPLHNHRTDEYGGSIENRARLFRELLEETKDAVGDTCAVVVRMAVDELMGERGIVSTREGHEVVEMLAEVPDLWDVNCSDWTNDSISSRFAEEGFQEPYIDFVKRLTTKPVVGVGRYTSPDRMVSVIRRGVMDMIGAARPSIADPFLPKKIEEGRIEDIRECIGCNMCVGYANHMVPMRCTQNPTVGEEWRRGWHPERIAAKDTGDTVLVVGAGPAGLEAARALGQRGYDVTLAEAGPTLGGRVRREAALPGLSAWGRVRDYREYQLAQMGNVKVYRDSRMDADTVLETGCSLIAVATGASWRSDGVGRSNFDPIQGNGQAHVFGPDEIMAGAQLQSPVVVFDDEQVYMGGVLAELAVRRGLDVTLVTPGAVVSAWTEHTLEQARIQTQLLELGVGIMPLHIVSAIGQDEVRAKCVYTGKEQSVAAASVVLVTTMAPVDALYENLLERSASWTAHGVRRVTRIGDCYGPGTIAAAVWHGHKFARSLGEPEGDEVPFKREVMELSADF
ncbi:MAG: NAD(P)-binding protein [Chromatiales bacterium]|nr:NAD(P)-binding protein [Chromatiales bacterium]